MALGFWVGISKSSSIILAVHGCGLFRRRRKTFTISLNVWWSGWQIFHCIGIWRLRFSAQRSLAILKTWNVEPDPKEFHRETIPCWQSLRIYVCSSHNRRPLWPYNLQRCDFWSKQAPAHIVQRRLRMGCPFLVPMLLALGFSQIIGISIPPLATNFFSDPLNVLNTFAGQIFFSKLAPFL